MKPFRAYSQASFFGASIMLAFAVLAGWRWAATGLLFFLLLVIRDLAAAYFLLVRRASQTGGSSGIQGWIAYFSAALPLAYIPASSERSWGHLVGVDALVIIGYALSSVALLELGKSFGIAPANRGRVSSGVYRIMRHPMYVGYVVAEFGLVMMNFANAPIFAFSVGLYWLRAQWENEGLASIKIKGSDFRL